MAASRRTWLVILALLACPVAAVLLVYAALAVFRTEIQVEGRVLDVAGQPVTGATVTLVSCDYPEKPWKELASTSTDDQGRFKLERVPDGETCTAVVEQGNTRHTYRPASKKAVSHFGDLPFAQDRDLVVRAHCKHALASQADSSRPLGIVVRLEWSGQLLVSAYLFGPDVEPGRTRDREGEQFSPGFDAQVYEPPKDARDFTRTLKVPPGKHKVEVSGGCGKLTTTIDVPEEGEVPALVLDLPP